MTTTTRHHRKTCASCGRNPATLTDHAGHRSCARCAERNAKLAAHAAALRDAKAAGLDPRDWPTFDFTTL